MKKLSFNYSLKNIPVPTEKAYKNKLIESVEHVIKRMRWKAFFYNNQQKDQERTETFGIKIRKCPPQVQEMISFENDLFDMIKNVKFKFVRNTFQSQLNQDLNKIRQSKNTFVFADKTRNIY